MHRLPTRSAPSPGPWGRDPRSHAGASATCHQRSPRPAPRTICLLTGAEALLHGPAPDVVSDGFRLIAYLSSGHADQSRTSARPRWRHRDRAHLAQRGRERALDRGHRLGQFGQREPLWPDDLKNGAVAPNGGLGAPDRCAHEFHRETKSGQSHPPVASCVSARGAGTSSGRSEMRPSSASARQLWRTGPAPPTSLGRPRRRGLTPGPISRPTGHWLMRAAAAGITIGACPTAAGS